MEYFTPITDKSTKWSDQYRDCRSFDMGDQHYAWA